MKLAESLITDQPAVFTNLLAEKVAADMLATVIKPEEVSYSPVEVTGNSWIDRIVSMPSEEQALALMANQIFQTPYNSVTAGHVDTTILAAVHDYGVAAVGRGFQLYRFACGESTYGGMQMKPSDDTERTDLPDYFEDIEHNMLVISKWSSNHDIYLHLMGGALMIKPITDILRVAAYTANDKDVDIDTQKVIGDDIDFSLSYVRQMWSSQTEFKTHQSSLRGNLIHMLEFLGQPGSREYGAELAEQQANALASWQRGEHVL